MPNGNGDELCRALLGDDRTRDITVVMHSQRKEVIEVVLVQDVTAMADETEVLEAARDRAMDLADAKSQFLASMSHEIRTPLNGVVGMLELLEGTELTPQQAHYVSMGIASAEGLLGVIGDVLDFSKIDAGRMELDRSPFNLPELAEETVQMLAGKASAKGLEAICYVQANVPTQVVGDPTRLRQILINLIGNAIKFTEGGEVGPRVLLDEADASTPRSASRSATPAWASAPRPASISSRPSARPTTAPPGASAGPAWGWPSATNWCR